MVDLLDVDRYLDRLCRIVSQSHSPTQLESADVEVDCDIYRVKWVGLFVTALVGIYTIEDLWNKFGDLRMSFVSPNRLNTHS